MRYLIDTHTYWWYRGAPRLLPESILALMNDMSHEILISQATPWELAIKTGAGKLRAEGLLVDFEHREIAAGFTILGITTVQIIQSGLLPRHHRDPFDRLLVAQALDLRVPLLSSDKTLDLYGVTRIWG
jgi:PIN domain nuclease of toxin-antitoxin system